MMKSVGVGIFLKPGNRITALMGRLHLLKISAKVIMIDADTGLPLAVISAEADKMTTPADVPDVFKKAFEKEG